MYVFFDKYNKMWEKVSNIIKKEFKSELVYNRKYLKTKGNQHKRKISLCFCMSNRRKRCLF